MNLGDANTFFTYSHDSLLLAFRTQLKEPAHIVLIIDTDVSA